MNVLKTWRFILALLLAGIFFVVGTGSAQAQDEDADEAEVETTGEGGVLYKKKTEYDFEDDTITGDLTKPDGEFLSSRERTRHRSLIKIRENFKPEILRSVNEL